MKSIDSNELTQFNLGEFLTRIPPTDAQGKRIYEQIIIAQAKENTSQRTAYSEQWSVLFRTNPDLKETLNHLTSQNILVDLGSGGNSSLADQGVQSAEYIAVDKFVELYDEHEILQSNPSFPHELRRRFSNSVSPAMTKEDEDAIFEEVLKAQSSNGPPPAISIRRPAIEPGVPTKIQVKADMLDFLEHVPDDSCCITINGIDYNLGINDDYHYTLAQEMARACKIGGVVFGVDSDSLQILKRRPEFQVLKEGSNWLILQKKNVTELHIKHKSQGFRSAINSKI